MTFGPELGGPVPRRIGKGLLGDTGRSVKGARAILRGFPEMAVV